MSRLFSGLPSLNDLLEAAPLKGAIERFGRNRAVAETAQFLDRLRVQAQSAAQQAFHFTTQDLAQRVARWIAATAPTGQRSVLNATGVLLPAGLMGPPLAAEAIDAMAHVASAYQSGDQQAAVSSLVQKHSGFEQAFVFTSPSAALLATLAALAGGRSIVLRRGELERDPQETAVDELARFAGVTLREVGSVNATELRDYEQSLEGSALVAYIELRHSTPSAARPDLAALAQLSTRYSVPLLADLGWTGIADVSSYGLSQLTLRSARSAGIDLAIVRGHGLLGGPACGILAGRPDLIERVAAHPLAAVAKAGSPVLAGLAATLQLYDAPDTVTQRVPLLELVATSAENLKQRAERLAPQIAAVTAVESAEVVATTDTLSGLSVPGSSLSGWGVAIKPAQSTPLDFAAKLLAGTYAIQAAVENDRVVLHLRSLAPKYDIALIDAIAALGAPSESASSANQATPA
jgi:L-seryl-tRNA(Ser) seleniumtransferase